MRRLVWFSCGAASAVAAKLAVDKYGDACEVIYCDTMQAEHPDNRRFFSDVEHWIGRTITVIKSDKYSSVDEVFEKRRYMSGIRGAICTVEMKKIQRESFQRIDDIHIFGYTADEWRRADAFEDTNPSLVVEWILVDEWITKSACLDRLRSVGIRLPDMYSLGFEHNNCIGCVKSSSPGYWNRIRRLFPEVFNRRARQSRLIGCKLVKVDDERRYLDELPEDIDSEDDAIDCGPVCQLPLFGES